MPSILDQSSGNPTASGIANMFGNSLLNIGKQINRSGIGLSAGARQGIDGFINATQQGYNNLFSLATGPSLTISGMQTQIKALRASLPISSLGASVIAFEDDNADNGAASASSKGQAVDTEA